MSFYYTMLIIIHDADKHKIEIVTAKEACMSCWMKFGEDCEQTGYFWGGTVGIIFLG